MHDTKGGCIQRSRRMHAMCDLRRIYLESEGIASLHKIPQKHVGNESAPDDRDRVAETMKMMGRLEKLRRLGHMFVVGPLLSR